MPSPIDSISDSPTTRFHVRFVFQLQVARNARSTRSTQQASLEWISITLLAMVRIQNDETLTLTRPRAYSFSLVELGESSKVFKVQQK
jgi:hypothetical protein